VRGCKRNAKRPGNQQHEDVRNARMLAKKLGVTRKWYAGIVDDRLLYRRRDDAPKLSAEAAFGCTGKRSQHGGGVAGIKLARHGTHIQRNMQHGQAPGIPSRMIQSLIDFQRQSEHARPLQQQIRVGGYHPGRLPRRLRQPHDEVGANAGGLTRRDHKWRNGARGCRH
jgi:hypothetical protein